MRRKITFKLSGLRKFPITRKKQHFSTSITNMFIEISFTVNRGEDCGVPGKKWISKGSSPTIRRVPPHDRDPRWWWWGLELGELMKQDFWSEGLIRDGQASTAEVVEGWGCAPKSLMKCAEMTAEWRQRQRALLKLTAGWRQRFPHT